MGTWMGPRSQELRTLRLRDIGHALHHLVGRRGRVGGERRGERGSLHDLIVITIVPLW